MELLCEGADRAGFTTAIVDVLTSACTHAFPEGRDLSVSDLVEINEGWECQVYAFALHTSDGDPRTENLILRIYQGRDAAGKCEGEWTALTALARGDFPVPAVFYHETEPGIDGKPFMIMERITGPQLADLLRTAGGDQERTALLGRFCRLLADLHSLEWRSLVPNPAELEARDGIAHWIEMARRAVEHFGIDEVDPVLAWLEERRAGITLAPPSVTHNDYHPWNILCPSPHDLVVIDWTSAEIQDFRFDLAWTLLLATSSLRGNGRDQILAGYEAARGEPVVDLAYFEVIAALRRIGDILISLRHGAEAMGMRPGAEALMSAEDRHLRAAYELLKARTGLEIPSLESAG